MAKLGDITYQAESLKRLGGMKKDRIGLGKQGLIVRPNSIWLDGITQ